MCRLLLTISLVSFLWAGSAWASIGRTQSSQIGGLNLVVWGGGIGSAQSQNQGSFTQTQQASDYHSHVSVLQTERGSLKQTATASGLSLGIAGQAAGIKGSQDLLAQTTRGFPNRAQQELEVKMGTLLFRPHGVGTVNGTQTYKGMQEQAVTTPCATSYQSQSVDVRQSGSITTGTKVDPLVLNTLNINLRQSQVTNSPSPR